MSEKTADSSESSPKDEIVIKELTPCANVFSVSYPT